MMMVEIEIMKKTIENQTFTIVDGMNTELDKRNIGGDTYQDKMVLEEVKRLHEMMYTKLSSVTSNVNGKVLYNNPDFQYFSNLRWRSLR